MRKPIIQHVPVISLYDCIQYLKSLGFDDANIIWEYFYVNDFKCCSVIDNHDDIEYYTNQDFDEELIPRLKLLLVVLKDVCDLPIGIRFKEGFK
jgi:hypothetical protein